MVQDSPVDAVMHWYGRARKLDATLDAGLAELDYPGGWTATTEHTSDTEAIVTLTSPPGLSPDGRIVAQRHRTIRRPGRGWVYAEQVGDFEVIHPPPQ